MSNQEESFDSLALEKWLESYFLDPLTSFLDHYTFRIDIFETAEEYILEALLIDFELTSISIYIDQCQISISVIHQGKTTSRSVKFPILINKQVVSASFSKGILEISISKKKTLPICKNRFVKVIFDK
ncbi:Hsp20/alpha crystallin family protein [Cytobacillus sp. Hz8]|uniref:Hsp20/alpha crystallin family protein n=1 Tax=Cytobacillus sp. Hz8 TaxID=3347168 RepID=UPI0035E13A4E